jgi:hypothetical protein
MDNFKDIGDSDIILPDDESIRNKDSPMSVLKRVNEINLDEFSTFVDLGKQNLDFDTSKMKLIKFTSDFLLNLDLNLVYKKKLVKTQSKIKFDETLGYDEDSLNKFRQLLLYQEAYFSSDLNVFKPLSEHFAAATNNARVMILWRDINLTEENIKRILTLGISLLCNFISKAEFLVAIRNIKSIVSTVEVHLEYKERRYIIIKIRSPIFNS